MQRVTKWVALVAIGLASFTAEPSTARAGGRSRIEWVRVDVPPREDSARLQKLLKQALGQAAKKANFGKSQDGVARPRGSWS